MSAHLLARSLVVACLAILVGCSGASTDGAVSSTTDAPPDAIGAGTTQTTPPDGATDPTTTSEPDDDGAWTTDPPAVYFATLGPGAELPDGQACAELVLAEDSIERRPDNLELNETVIDIRAGLDPFDDSAVAPIVIDGADERWNTALAPRIDGDFTGTTDQILRWGACKWGFDEDVTRARAVTESSWRAAHAGDETDDGALCVLIGLPAPCDQSYGLLQVKGTVHEGTYPATTRSSAFGVDYAMAWLRACFEGSFLWLADDGYAAGDELGCVGVWFSGEWWDQDANDYVGEVRFHLGERTWESYHP